MSFELITASIGALGLSYFGRAEPFFEWLKTPNGELDGAAPIDVCATKFGQRTVKDLLQGLHYGDSA